MRNDTVRPGEIQGKEVLSHIQNLMNKLSPVSEEIKNSVIEIAKLGADNKIYAIVRENHNYYIKTAENRKGLVVEDFNYIGGLQNYNKEELYPTYAKALKRLNNRLISLAETYGARGEINAFANEATNLGIGCSECSEVNEEEDMPGLETVYTVDDTDGDNIDVKDIKVKGDGITSVQEAFNSGDDDSYILPKNFKNVFESIDEVKKKILNKKDILEATFKLKVPVEQPQQQVASPIPQEPQQELGGLNDFPQDNELSNDKPFDDSQFEAGVDADEESDPKKFIQQLSGKLGQSLRKYNGEQKQTDFELEKFVVNSVVSATHTGQMNVEDQKEIIKKIESAGKGGENDNSNNIDNTSNDEENVPEPSNDQADGENGNVPEKQTENINKNLQVYENNRIFAKKDIMYTVKNKITTLNEAIEEVFSAMGSGEQETEKEVETQTTKAPETEKSQPEKTPRKAKPWIFEPSKEPDTDPKAKK